MTTEQTAALQFAHRHDWGVAAYIDADGNVAGLIETTVSAEGRTESHLVTVPATIAALRTFGGY